MNPISSGLSSMVIRNTLLGLNREQTNSLRRLSTGEKSFQDEPAAMITAEQLRGVLAELEAELKTAQRTDMVVATADGALGEVSSLLNDAEALAVANAGSTLSDAEREANQLELDSITSSINRIAGSTAFNGSNLLDGTASVSLSGQTVDIDAVSVGDIDILESPGDGQIAIRDLRNQISTQRGELGAFSRHTVQSRINSLSIGIENVSAAESLLRDVDIAEEVSQLNRLQTLQLATTGALRLAQTSSSSGILELSA